MNAKNYHQSPEEIIKAATPEQRILWNYIFLLCGDRLSLSQLFYCGLMAGSEFLTYTAGKLYLALELTMGCNAAGGTGGERVDFFNPANAVFLVSRNISMYFNAATVTAWGVCYDVTLRNLYFSRILSSGQYSYLLFKGYRIVY